MTTVKIASITFDCPDADALARFYGELLGLEEAYAAEDRSNVCLGWGETMISFVTNPHYVAPAWPAQPAHVHLDIYADDLDAAVKRAVELGASQPLSSRTRSAGVSCSIRPGTRSATCRPSTRGQRLASFSGAAPPGSSGS